MHLINEVKNFSEKFTQITNESSIYVKYKYVNIPIE